MTFSAQKLTCIRGERVIFSALDFNIPEGSVLLLKGPNGSGKSSLLRISAGFLKPQEGIIAWNHSPLDPDTYSSKISYMGHLDPIKPSLTVRENLDFWVRLRKKNNTTTEKIFHTLNIENLAELPASFLSQGQKRRLNFARVVAESAKLWILDEPTDSFDRESEVLFTEILKKHLSMGGLAMIATHNNLDISPANTLELGNS